MERTLVVLKPDAVQRSIVGEIVSRFERVGMKIVGMKMLAPSKDHFYKHYEEIGTMITRHGEDIFNNTLDFMMAGPVIAMVLEGVEAVEVVRKMTGSTEPKSSEPGTIRGDYSHLSYQYSDSKKASIPNIIHASGDKEEAKKEIDHWFSDFELYEYETLHEHYTHARYAEDEKEKKKDA